MANKVLWTIIFPLCAIVGCNTEGAQQSDASLSPTLWSGEPPLKPTGCTKGRKEVTVDLGDLAGMGDSALAAALARERLSNEVKCSPTSPLLIVKWSELGGGFCTERQYQYHRSRHALIYISKYGGLSVGRGMPPDKRVYSKTTDAFIHDKRY